MVAVDERTLAALDRAFARQAPQEAPPLARPRSASRLQPSAMVLPSWPQEPPPASAAHRPLTTPLGRRPTPPPLSDEAGGAGGEGPPARAVSAESTILTQIHRSPAERLANPERLNADGRGLVVMPALEGEQELKLLNYQNNRLSWIGNLHNLPSLVFLDLYNNQIRHISALESVPTLRVLMLGKNRIERVERLEGVPRLDVLDLHGNAIRVIENIGHLSELRVLNVAANQIKVLDGLIGLRSLVELNARRNVISHVGARCDELRALQRCFLNANAIETLERIRPLFKLPNLAELALENNPVAALALYQPTLLASLPALRLLDGRRLTDAERRPRAPSPGLSVQNGHPSSHAGLARAAELASLARPTNAAAAPPLDESGRPKPQAGASPHAEAIAQLATRTAALQLAAATAAAAAATAVCGESYSTSRPTHRQAAALPATQLATQPQLATAATQPATQPQLAIAAAGSATADAAADGGARPPAATPRAISPNAARLAQQRLRLIEQARSVHTAERAARRANAAAADDGVPAAREGAAAAAKTWAGRQGDSLTIYGNHPPGAALALDGVARASLSYVTGRCLATRWLPRLREASSVRALVLSDCAIDSLAELYALLPLCTETLTELSLVETAATGGGGVCTHPLFRVCALSLLPRLETLNGERVEAAERADAVRRGAALLAHVRAAPSAPPGTGARARAQEAGDSTSAEGTVGAVVGAVLQQALTIDAKLRALNQIWPDVVRVYADDALSAAARGGAERGAE